MTDVQGGSASNATQTAATDPDPAAAAQAAKQAQATANSSHTTGTAVNDSGTPRSHARLDTTAIWLAYITTFGFFALIATLIVLDRTTTGAPNPSAYRDILLTLMGIVGTAWAGIISFYFGSSVGSRTQSDTLQQISKSATSS